MDIYRLLYIWYGKVEKVAQVAIYFYVRIYKEVIEDMAGKSKINMEVPYFQTPNAIFDRKDLGLDPLEKLVYIYLCRCGNHGAKAFPSYQTIAESTGISKRKVIDVIDKLVQKEYVSKKPRNKDGSRTSNVYYVDTLVHTMHHPSAQDAPYKEPLKKKYKRKNKRPTLTGADVDVLMQIGAIK